MDLTSDRLVAAFVFPEAWRDRSRFRALLAAFGDYGVNALLTETDSYEEAAIDAAHEAGLRFYAGIACFSDHATNFRKIVERPELWPVLETGERRPQMEWYVGITPTDRRQQREVLSAIQSVAATYPIDGLFLDFVRWPLHWEIEFRPGHPPPLDSSFDPGTLSMFEEATGIQLTPDTIPAEARADWILKRQLPEWVDFKCGVISKFVGEAHAILKGARQDAALGLFVVPEVDGRTESLTGQRLRDLAPLADFVAPMLYHNILLRPSSWISEALAAVVPVAGGKTLPVLQVDSNRDPALAADWGPPMSSEDWRATLSEVAGRKDLAGLAVFPGDSLVRNGRGRLLREVVG
jgi:hypothetical protein